MQSAVCSYLERVRRVAGLLEETTLAADDGFMHIVHGVVAAAELEVGELARLKVPCGVGQCLSVCFLGRRWLTWSSWS